MKKIYSSGGVVFLGNSILMLRKINGDWVLPKGKLEKEETSEEAALREVREETGVKATILAPIGETVYRFKNYWSKNSIVEKKVDWYVMRALSTKTHPQREEGFVEAKFIHVNNASRLAKYKDEQNILKEAIEIMKELSE